MSNKDSTIDKIRNIAKDRALKGVKDSAKLTGGPKSTEHTIYITNSTVTLMNDTSKLSVSSRYKSL